MFSINFRRGLFRLWTVASFVWLVIAGAFVQEGIRRDVSVLMTTELQSPAPQVGQVFSGKGTPLPPGFVLEDPVSELDELRARLLAGTEDTRTPSQRAQDNLMVSASVLLLPPILAFALGWAGLWIVRGFRS